MCSLSLYFSVILPCEQNLLTLPPKKRGEKVGGRVGASACTVIQVKASENLTFILISFCRVVVFIL